MGYKSGFVPLKIYDIFLLYGFSPKLTSRPVSSRSRRGFDRPMSPNPTFLDVQATKAVELALVDDHDDITQEAFEWYKNIKNGKSNVENCIAEISNFAHFDLFFDQNLRFKLSKSTHF